MINLYCVGDNNVDIYLHTGTVYPGGCCLNVAAVAAMNGHKAAFVSAVGKDRLGDLQADSLAALGVDVSHLHRIDAQTAWCFITVKDGDRIFGEHDPGAKAELPISAEDIKLGQNGEYDVIYTSLDARYAPGAIEQFGESDIPSICDFTTRWTEELLEDYCRYFDYAYISFEDLEEDKVKKILMDCVDKFGVKLALGTMGMRGSMVYNGRRFYRQGSYKVKTADSLGAGDSFLSTFTVSYFDGLKMLDNWMREPAMQDAIDGYNECVDGLIEQSLRLAALRAARTCQNLGGIGFGIPFENWMIGR